MIPSQEIEVEVLQAEPGESVTTNILCCSRCGKFHEQLRFTRFSMPGPLYTHWAPCPENGEPVLMRIIHDPPIHVSVTSNPVKHIPGQLLENNPT
jgi:hypothetical protein